MSNESRRITFGPVPSRRLGRSLGVDMLPFKTCTYDCVYCQLGPTTRTSIRRAAFRDPREVVAAVGRVLDERSGVDVLTFSGSGEPTLERNLGRTIRALKEAYALPVVVLTNGALLYRPEVRAELLNADFVLPSMDGWTEEPFRRINRPHPSLRLAAILQGLVSFRNEFTGQLWLEILFVEGINDSLDDLPGLVDWLARIQPDRVQINTVVRPPAESWARAVSLPRLQEIRAVLGSGAEIIAPFRGESERAVRRDLEARVEEMVLRRPLSPEDLVSVLGMGLQEAGRLLERLAEQRSWAKESVGGRMYFRAPTTPPSPRIERGRNAFRK
jgi:wyosine [tRNA(Phe)-imidazoG37] synthetase (radical SAM superfamily)